MTRKQIATAKSKRDLIQTVKRIIRRHPESEAARIIVEAIYELYVEGKGVTRP